MIILFILSPLLLCLSAAMLGVINESRTSTLGWFGPKDDPPLKPLPLPRDRWELLMEAHSGVPCETCGTDKPLLEPWQVGTETQRMKALSAAARELAASTLELEGSTRAIAKSMHGLGGKGSRLPVKYCDYCGGTNRRHGDGCRLGSYQPPTYTRPSGVLSVPATLTQDELDQYRELVKVQLTASMGVPPVVMDHGVYHDSPRAGLPVKRRWA